MDKLSVLLISGICFLTGVSAYVIYGTWFSNDRSVEAVQAVNATTIEEEMALSNIAMNDDVQVINGGGHDMWVRVLVEIPIVNGKAAFEMVSDTIVKKPKGKEGVWYQGKDGYYYYSSTVRPGEQSNSLFQRLKPLLKDKQIMPDSDSVRVEAEAVQVNWVYNKAQTGPEAFKLFNTYDPINGNQVMNEAI